MSVSPQYLQEYLHFSSISARIFVFFLSIYKNICIFPQYLQQYLHFFIPRWWDPYEVHEAFLTQLIFIFFYKTLSGLCTHPSIPQIFRATKITHKVSLNPELSPGFCCPHGCSSHSLSQELLAIIVHVKLGFFFFPHQHKHFPLVQKQI